MFTMRGYKLQQDPFQRLCVWAKKKKEKRPHGHKKNPSEKWCYSVYNLTFIRYLLEVESSSLCGHRQYRPPSPKMGRNESNKHAYKKEIDWKSATR